MKIPKVPDHLTLLIEHGFVAVIVYGNGEPWDTQDYIWLSETQAIDLIEVGVLEADPVKVKERKGYTTFAYELAIR